MVDFLLRTHKDDKDMLEILSEEKNGRLLLYGVVHCDFIADAFKVRNLLEIQDTVRVSLELGK